MNGRPSVWRRLFQRATEAAIAGVGADGAADCALAATGRIARLIAVGSGRSILGASVAAAAAATDPLTRRTRPAPLRMLDRMTPPSLSDPEHSPANARAFS